MTTAQRIDLRLFLEGIEVPVISAVVNSTPNQAATAAIQIPANDYALLLKPRTLVHLFFFDFYNGAPSGSQVFTAGEGIRRQERVDVDPELAGLLPPERFESSPDEDAVDLENENYRLLFGGEVVGINFQKTPTGRAVVLQCMDWSSYWDTTYQYQVSGMSLGGGGLRAAFTGSSTNLFNSFLEGSGDIVVRLMSQPPRNYPELRGTLLGAIVHILEAMGGVYFGNRVHRGVNDFFSLAEMRLHITQMIGANPFPNRDEVRLMRARGFGSLFRRSIAGLGKMVSIRKLMMALQRYIFHEHVPIVTPRYIPPLSDPNVPQVERVSLREDPDTRSLHRAATVYKRRAEELKERQEMSTDEQQARSLSRRRGGIRNELQQLVRSAERAARRTRLLATRRTSRDSPFAELFDLPGISQAFSVTANRFSRSRFLLQGSGRRSFYASPGTPNGQQFVATMDQIIADMDRVLNSTHLRRPRRGSGSSDKPQRLNTQIYRPDVWMVAPPRCNFVFPELYSSFTYNRQFLREVTRLMLRTHSAFFGSDVLFDGFYMAPSRALGTRTGRRPGRGRFGADPPDLTDAPAWFVRDLMNHELFTGILPAFERMSDLNLHALRGGHTVINGVRVGYAQLAANHIFFQYRFRSRQLQYSGKFNPFLALGFPAVIMDKYLRQDQADNAEYDAAIAARLADAQRDGEGSLGGLPDTQRQQRIEQLDDREADLIAGLLAEQPNSHFLGTIKSMTHNVSAAQQMAMTNAQMDYARVSNEGTEFLGDDQARQSRARRRRNTRITTNVAALSEPQTGARGPRGGNIVEVQDVTDRYTRSRQRLRSTNRTATGRTRFQGGTRLPLYVATDSGVTAGRRRRGTRVLVGVEQSAFSYGPEVVALVGGAGTQRAEDTLVEFRAFRVVEEVGAYERRVVDLPAEDLVFPPWYGEHYRSNRIGGLYQFYFGTGSIVDPLSIIEPQTQVTNNPGTDGVSASGEPVDLSMRPEGSPAISSPEQAPPAGESQIIEANGQQVGPPGTDSPGVIEDVEARSTIENAIEDVVRAYSLVRQRRFDVNEFIRAYTWRPIASITDLFGTANLQINEDGVVERGREGFHSRAFGDFDDLRQLVRNVEGRPRSILGLTVRDSTAEGGGTDARAQRDAVISADLDTRKEKRLPVFRYLHALLASRGILG